MGNILFSCLKISSDGLTVSDDYYEPGAFDAEESYDVCSSLSVRWNQVPMMETVDGSIFKAVANGGRFVSLKRVKAEKELLAKKETNLLTQLDHENILRFIFDFRKDDILYVMTDYHQKTLSSCVATLKNSTGIILQLFKAVEYLQSHRIAHLNLTPENIFIVDGFKGETVKLTDFSDFKQFQDDSDVVSLPKAWTLYTIRTRTSKDFSAPEVRQHGIACLASDNCSIGYIIFFVQTQGVIPYQGIYNNTAEAFSIAKDLNVLQSSDLLCIDLIHKLVSSNPHQRLSVSDAQTHAFFWDSKQTASMFIEVVRLIETEDDMLRKLLYDGSADVLGGSEDWTLMIENKVLDELKEGREQFQQRVGNKKNKKSKFLHKNIVSLIQTMRNLVLHAHNTQYIAALMGTDQMLLDYWLGKFPGLIVHIYNASCEYKKLK